MLNTSHKHLESGNNKPSSLETAKNKLDLAKQVAQTFWKKIKDIAFTEVKLPKFGKKEEQASLELKDTVKNEMRITEDKKSKAEKDIMPTYREEGSVGLLSRDSQNNKFKMDGFGPDERDTKWQDDTWHAYKKLSERSYELPDLNVPTNTPDEILHFISLATQSMEIPFEKFLGRKSDRPDIETNSVTKELLIARAEMNTEYLEKIGHIKSLLITNKEEARKEATDLKEAMLETGLHASKQAILRDFPDEERIIAIQQIRATLKEDIEVE